MDQHARLSSKSREHSVEPEMRGAMRKCIRRTERKRREEIRRANNQERRSKTSHKEHETSVIYWMFNYIKHHVYYVSINNFIYYVFINNSLEQHVYNNMLFMSLILD